LPLSGCQKWKGEKQQTVQNEQETGLHNQELYHRPSDRPNMKTASPLLLSLVISASLAAQPLRAVRLKSQEHYD
jgi:hypothetical protein